MSSIMSLLNQVAGDEVVLPAIQRDFVWDEEKVEKLLDSIMRKYPVGLALLWKPMKISSFAPSSKTLGPASFKPIEKTRADAASSLSLMDSSGSKRSTSRCSVRGRGSDCS